MHKKSRFNVRYTNSLVLATLLLSAALLAGCTAQPSAVPSATVGVTNGAIIQDPSSFEGKELVLNGKIATECGSGCWFLLDDGTGQIYVDLAENNFAIPQTPGLHRHRERNHPR